eukprot:scaffold6036_cov371-Prasinococcus_capsulatus_cf.AAC.7
MGQHALKEQIKALNLLGHLLRGVVQLLQRGRQLLHMRERLLSQLKLSLHLLEAPEESAPLAEGGRVAS